jgi:Ubiquitin carboxyl-terminal hydrolase
LRRTDLVKDIVESLSKLCGCADPTRLVLCEIFENAIVGILPEARAVGEMLGGTDLITAYEVDPLVTTDGNVLPVYHACVSHKWAETETPAGELVARPELFGIPFMMSFSAETTCRQVWEHLWSAIDHIVDGDESYKALLNIRVHNGRGQPIEAFPTNTTTGMQGLVHLEAAMTSSIPEDSNEKLMTRLGPNSTHNFLFVWLEWQERPYEDPANDGELDGQGPRVDEDRFLVFTKHESWLEAARKQALQRQTRGVSLDECFSTFIKPERLDENNMWYCSKCNEHVRAMKTMELWRLPNVLIVHLKRFEFKHALRRDKLDTLVDFPLEGLDMSKHCASFEDNNFADGRVPAVYDLFAVTNHFGRMGFGHYTAFARRWDEDGISKEWTLFDDSSVHSVGNGAGAIESVLSPAAYVLFYRRRTFN